MMRIKQGLEKGKEGLGLGWGRVSVGKGWGGECQRKKND